MTRLPPNPPRAVCAGLLASVLAACSGAADQSPPANKTNDTATEAPADQVSIIRPEVEIDRAPDTLEPLELRIGFDEGGTRLSDSATGALSTILSAPQMEAGGPITLRGHTDSAGQDDANLRVSEQRANAVRDWLIGKGVAANRISVIAMGEQNPAKPNAKPDGSPDEAARAFNRRVDLTIGVEKAAAEAEDEGPQTLVERVAAED